VSARRRLSLVATAVAAVLLGTGAVAHAHTTMAGSNPAADARLDQSPSRVVVSYSDPLGAASTGEVRAGGRDLAGPVRLDPQDARRLIIPLTGRAVGPHRVSWVVVAADGHSMGGELSFVVRPAPLVVAAHRIGRQLAASAAVIREGLPAPS
jgi:methionine-rich copper-binding protein CopC